MTSQEWLAILTVVLGLAGGLALVRFIASQFYWSPEVARKTIHVAMGLVCAAFPWIFDRPLPVWILAALSTIPLIILRSLPRLRATVGSALHGVERPSYGEVLFAPAVALVFQLSHGDALLHAIPVGVLTLADTAGAIAGTRWGRHRYSSGEGLKSVEGSFAFVVAAFLCTALPIALTGRTAWPEAICIGAIVALLAMMAEGLADRGFDNLILPPGVLLLLIRLLPLGLADLSIRTLSAGALLALVTTAAHWSSLSGGALLGAALFGYGCATLADPRFVLPPVAMFLFHLATMRRHHLKSRFDHRLDAVLSQVFSTFPWILAVTFHQLPTSIALAGVTFAMACQIALSDASTRWELEPRKLCASTSTIKGWLTSGLAGLLWLLPFTPSDGYAIGGGLLTTLIATVIYQQLRRRFTGDTTGLWMLKGALALAASFPAFWFHS